MRTEHISLQRGTGIVGVIPVPCCPWGGVLSRYGNNIPNSPRAKLVAVTQTQFGGARVTNWEQCQLGGWGVCRGSNWACAAQA